MLTRKQANNYSSLNLKGQAVKNKDMTFYKQNLVLPTVRKIRRFAAWRCQIP
jgi:hypothetical protein